MDVGCGIRAIGALRALPSVSFPRLVVPVSKGRNLTPITAIRDRVRPLPSKPQAEGSPINMRASMRMRTPKVSASPIAFSFPVS